MEGDEGVEVAFARDGFVGDKKQEGYAQPCDKARDIEKHREGQKHYADELHAIAKLVVGLAEACKGYKRHIEYCFGGKPAHFDGKFRQRDCAYYAHCARKACGGIECCKAQAVDGNFKYYKLPEYRHVVLIVGNYKLERFGDKCGMCILSDKIFQICYQIFVSDFIGDFLTHRKCF